MFETSEKAEKSGSYSPGRSIIGKYESSNEGLGEPAAPKKPKRKRGPNLESPEMRRLHGTLMGFVLKETERQRENRVEIDKDHRCYDNDQWEEHDKLILKSRGQQPITLNVVATSVDWMIGTELRSRVDYKVLARRKEHTGQAERKTDLLKYLGDVNNTHFHRSRAFQDAIKGGIGWLEDGVQPDEDGEPVYSRYESWRHMLWDTAATELDLSDARYVIRNRWVDADIASMWFPKREETIRLASQQNTMFGAFDLALSDEVGDYAEREMQDDTSTMAEYDAARPRVRLMEVWFRKPVQGLLKMRGGQFSGEVYDPWSEGHAADLQAGLAEVVETTGMQMHVAIMTTAGLLHVSESPYRHNQYPFTPIWCYRRDRDNLPYGVIRRLRGIQQDINWRAAKALHILSTNKIVTEKGAVDDVDELLEEAARPDAVIELNEGYFDKFKMDADRQLAPAHMEYMSRLIMMVEQVGGITNENLGRRTNATSGIAIERRQDQGSLSTALPFDMLRLAMQVSGRKQLCLVEQFFTEEKQIRITNARGTPNWIDVNDGVDPASMVGWSKADFIISEDAWQATVRAAQAEQLLALARELAATAPEAVVVMLDLIIDSLDIPNREELVKRVRAINGQRDPDSDQPTPEEQAQAAEKAAAAERAVRMEEATIAEKEASGRQKAAQAEKTAADTLIAETKRILDRVAAQQSALEAALLAISARGAAPVADAILRESGFVSRSEEDDAAAVDAEASELEALAAEGAAMQEADAGADLMLSEQSAPTI